MGQFNVSTVGNTLKAVLEGQFSPEEIGAFGNAYQAAVKKINPAQYELLLDVTKMPVIASDKQDELKQFLSMYKAAGFKKITMVMQSNAVLSMQTKRLAKEVGLTDFDVK